MPTTLLMPGLGGKVDQTITLTANDTEVFGDTMDGSRCEAFSVQIKSYAGDGTLTVRVQQQIDDTNWADIDTAASPAVGAILRFTSQLGPFGMIKVGVQAAGATGVPDDVVIVILGLRAAAGY